MLQHTWFFARLHRGAHIPSISLLAHCIDATIYSTATTLIISGHCVCAFFPFRMFVFRVIQTHAHLQSREIDVLETVAVHGLARSCECEGINARLDIRAHKMVKHADGNDTRLSNKLKSLTMAAMAVAVAAKQILTFHIHYTLRTLRI